jgi:hypothetical protein
LKVTSHCSFTCCFWTYFVCLFVILVGLLDWAR